MEFRNLTCFPALPFETVGAAGETFLGVVLRQTLTFAGGSPVFAESQSSLCEKEVFFLEPNRSSVQAESDLCPFKPRCDFIVNAMAHAPSGRPAHTFLVRLQVHRSGASSLASPRPLLDKALLVSGPSRFRRRALPLRLAGVLVRVGTLGLMGPCPWYRTRPEEILSLPVRYEHAFGGENKVSISESAAARVPARDRLPGVDPRAARAAFSATGEDVPLAWVVFEANPVGKGFARPWFLRATRTRDLPAPQIEVPDTPVTARHFHRALKGRPLPGDDLALRPQGLGILAKSWQPRSALPGSVGDAFARTDQALPEDFDPAFWNGAPPDQQVSGMEGEETLVLTNLFPPGTPGAHEDPEGNTVLELPLPGHLPFLLIRYEEGDLEPVAMNLDTVSLDAGNSTLVMVWRCLLPVEPAIRVLEARMLERDEKAQVMALQAWLEQGSGRTGGA